MDGWWWGRQVVTVCVPPGHQMSQGDATSLEGEAPAVSGCYRQFEHSIPARDTDIPETNQVRTHILHHA